VSFKTPVSVLVVIHTPKLEILLLERTLHPGYWQSVTGSQETGEALVNTAIREVFEETGIATQAEQLRDWRVTNRYEIFPEWRYRYAPGTSHNTEHVFSLQVSAETPVRTAPEEHLAYQWLPWQKAATACFSWSNRDVILMLGQAAPAQARP